MIEQSPDSPDAVLVHIDFQTTEFNEELGEFIELVASSGISAVTTITCNKSVPNPKFFIGEGKVSELQKVIAEYAADLVIFNHAISPGQARNLERVLDCRVIDRVELILDIFAQRARSYEGKLQVEMAQLKHLSTRLVRGWTHLERQKGGIGLRGPGETQLETDRRLIGKRIKTINSRLDKVKSQRKQSAKKRKNSSLPVISLIGYTNAGKSTLFNRLTGADVYAADKLFATLDPTLRRYRVSSNINVLLTDTVGFIRHLPHELINAFHATLEETKDADLLLHIIDANDLNRHAHIQQVNQVLQQIGAAHVPQVEVYNKIDMSDIPSRIEPAYNGSPSRVWISALEGDGLVLLDNVITDLVSAKCRSHRLNLPASAGKLRAHLFEIGVVEEEQFSDQGGWILDVKMDSNRLNRLCIDSGVPDEVLQS